ncbi:hypothetical protein [Frigoribacterium sp. PvP032]|uniref:hypothetical protein n=1 Tax=Frigoribacterium sp. PvP032 TaxID=2806589 RepID=UPI001AE594C2
MNDQLSQFAWRSERNYAARLRYAKRLQSRGRSWTAALISLSLASTLVSIALLQEPSLYGDRGPFLWCAVGVLTLTASLVLGSAGYSEKSTLGFEAYRDFQRIAVDAAFADASHNSGRRRRRSFRRLNAEYQLLLDRTANHSTGDFAWAVQWKSIRKQGTNIETPLVNYVTPTEMARRQLDRFWSTALSSLPAVLIAASVLSVTPIALWAIRG